MVFGFLGGEFIDVITWLDDSRDTMVWRFERRGNAIKCGAKLTVREGQAAVAYTHLDVYKRQAERHQKSGHSCCQDPDFLRQIGTLHRGG